ncbi:MAG: molybdenum cofactor guanylyltransferase [Bacteroidia bacterium]
MNAIILAGGKATRLNGMNKGLILYNNKPFIEIIIDKISPFVKNIIISANSHEYDYLNYPVLSDVVKDIGPLGGIATCLEFSDEEKNLIISCDTPFITTDIIQHLINHQHKADIVVPVVNNNIHPLCAIYSKNILPVAYQQISNKNYTIKDLLKKTNSFYLPLPQSDERYLININNFDDLELLKQISQN